MHEKPCLIPILGVMFCTSKTGFSTSSSVPTDCIRVVPLLRFFFVRTSVVLYVKFVL